MNKNELKIKLLSFNVFEDNEYLDKYINLIITNEHTPRVLYKTQKHHIVPAHVYKLLSISVDNSSQNLVNLYYSDHVMAHFYLFHCSLDKRIRRGNFAALQYIVHNKYVPKSEEAMLAALPEYKAMYSEYVKLNSELLKESQRGEKNPFYGKHHTAETRAVLRDKIINLPPDVKAYNKQRTQEANLGRVKTEEEKQRRLATIESHGGYGFWITDEYRKKLSESTKGKNTHSKGRRHINNGSESKMVLPEELSRYLSNGWKLGRLPIREETRQAYKYRKRPKPNIGYVWVTNGIESHTIKPEELDTYIAQGYRRGRILVKPVK